MSLPSEALQQYSLNVAAFTLCLLDASARQRRPSSRRPPAGRTPAGRQVPLPEVRRPPAISTRPARACSVPYCGYLEKIAPSAKEVQEQDWDEFWRSHTEGKSTIEGRSSQVTCSACGAVVLLEDKVATDTLPLLRGLPGEPARVGQGHDRARRHAAFRRQRTPGARGLQRLARRPLVRPQRLYQFANLGKLSGVYVPFWTYDSMTYTHYTGERGDDYTGDRDLHRDRRQRPDRDEDAPGAPHPLDERFRRGATSSSTMCWSTVRGRCRTITCAGWRRGTCNTWRSSSRSF